MLGLVVQLVRLCIGLLTLLTRLLAFVIGQAVKLVDRHVAASRGSVGPDPAAAHDPASPSRRRTFKAPPRRLRRPLRRPLGDRP